MAPLSQGFRLGKANNSQSVRVLLCVSTVHAYVRVRRHVYVPMGVWSAFHIEWHRAPALAIARAERVDVMMMAHDEAFTRCMRVQALVSFFTCGIWVSACSMCV
jgi:hypothetical protein